MVINAPLKRAHHPAQKEVRREGILAAARAGLATTPYEQLSMAALADAAGIAKGTLYLYFPTKEALFLGVLEADFRDAFDEVAALLTRRPRPATADAVATVFARVMAARPLLRDLVGRMHSVLEHNIGYDTARHFKTVLRDGALRLGAAIEACLPALPPGGGVETVFEAHVLIVGWQHAAHPAPVIRDVQSAPDLQMFRAEFEPRFQRSFAALLRGRIHP